jgi:hypothetical protein
MWGGVRVALVRAHGVRWHGDARGLGGGGWGWSAWLEASFSLSGVIPFNQFASPTPGGLTSVGACAEKGTNRTAGRPTQRISAAALAVICSHCGRVPPLFVDCF